jgi:hypothetical protein
MFHTNVIKKIKTHFLCQVHFRENRAVYKIIREKIGRAGQATGDNIMRRVPFLCWITQATRTHSECVSKVGPNGMHQLLTLWHTNFVAN